MASPRRVTVRDLRKLRAAGQKLAMVTCYDYASARILDSTGVELILVGDSLGMVVLGLEDTIGVTMEHMIHHGAAVRRGTTRAMVVVDMPFLSYNVSDEQALMNAGRLVQEGGAHGVKLEGGVEVASRVRTITDSGLPVMGHLGMTPQSVHQKGGLRLQGTDEESVAKLLLDAEALERAGAFAIVLEAVPTEVAQLITSRCAVPTIGIGAGPHCDGQVLVLHDLLGLFPEFEPPFAKAFVDLHGAITAAVGTFRDQVRDGSFPDPGHSFAAPVALAPYLRALQQGTRSQGDGGR